MLKKILCEAATIGRGFTAGGQNGETGTHWFSHPNLPILAASRFQLLTSLRAVYTTCGRGSKLVVYFPRLTVEFPSNFKPDPNPVLKSLFGKTVTDLV